MKGSPSTLHDGTFLLRETLVLEKENKTHGFGEVIRARVYCLLSSTHAKCDLAKVKVTDQVKGDMLRSSIWDRCLVLLEILWHY